MLLSLRSAPQHSPEDTYSIFCEQYLLRVAQASAQVAHIFEWYVNLVALFGLQQMGALRRVVLLKRRTMFCRGPMLT